MKTRSSRVNNAHETRKKTRLKRVENRSKTRHLKRSFK
jgi:hypothetical protein